MKLAGALGIVALVVIAVIGLVWMLNRQSHAIVVESVSARSVDGMPGTLVVLAGISNQGRADWLLAAGSGEASASSFVNPTDHAGPLPVASGSTPQLALDGVYLLLTGVEGDLRQGRLVPVWFEFREAGKVVAKARIGSALPGDTDLSAPARTLELTGAAPEVDLDITALNPGWRLQLRTSGIRLVEPGGDSDGNDLFGHAHLYVGGLKYGRVFSESVDIGKLPVGTHAIRLELYSDDHRALTVGGRKITDSGLVTVHR
ncbi:MAG: hypothetical protein OXF74_12350 [Rhodobacteraceae bacterium]|nr:hypothetical protein [Paracoccaceae bacterium]